MKTIVDDIMEKMPEQFNMLEIMAKVEERTPYVIVCFQVMFRFYYFLHLKCKKYILLYTKTIIFQECERMNTLTAEMKRSLKELDLGLKGELTITSDMEDLSNSLFFDQVEFVIILLN